MIPSTPPCGAQSYLLEQIQNCFWYRRFGPQDLSSFPRVRQAALPLMMKRLPTIQYYAQLPLERPHSWTPPAHPTHLQAPHDFARSTGRRYVQVLHREFCDCFRRRHVLFHAHVRGKTPVGHSPLPTFLPTMHVSALTQRQVHQPVHGGPQNGHRFLRSKRQLRRVAQQLIAQSLQAFRALHRLNYLTFPRSIVQIGRAIYSRSCGR